MKLQFLNIVISLLIVIAWTPTCFSSNNPVRVVCYFLSWARYRTGFGGIGQFTTDNIDPSLCTHMLYCEANIDSEDYTIKTKDFHADIYNKGYNKFVALKMKNPKLKVMISVRNFVGRVDKYSQLLTNNSNIHAFIQSAVAFLQLYKFDGLDFNWNSFSRADISTGFTNLILELKNAFRPHGYLLSSHGNQFKNAMDIVSIEDAARLNANLDFLNVWTMGFYDDSSEPDSADHHAPLFKRSWDIHDWNADFAVSNWITKGISPDKITLGIPLYGTSWTLTSTEIAPPALAAGAGAPGKCTTEAGMMAYYEICDAVRSDGWTVVHDPSEAMGPYAVSPFNSPNKTWIGYDDPAMAIVKSKYIVSKGLGGAFIWSIDLDDFRNICGGGINPILTAISRTLRGELVFNTERQTKSMIFPNSPIIPMNSTMNPQENGFCECLCG